MLEVTITKEDFDTALAPILQEIEDNGEIDTDLYCNRCIISSVLNKQLNRNDVYTCETISVGETDYRIPHIAGEIMSAFDIKTGFVNWEIEEERLQEIEEVYNSLPITFKLGEDD